MILKNWAKQFSLFQIHRKNRFSEPVSCNKRVFYIMFVHFSANFLPPLRGKAGMGGEFRNITPTFPPQQDGARLCEATASLQPEQGIRQLSPNSAASPTRILADVRWTSSPIKGEEKMYKLWRFLCFGI